MLIAAGMLLFIGLGALIACAGHKGWKIVVGKSIGGLLMLFGVGGMFMELDRVHQRKVQQLLASDYYASVVKHNAHCDITISGDGHSILVDCPNEEIQRWE